MTPERMREGTKRQQSSPFPVAPSPPIPGAASGFCKGYSPNHRSWAQQTLKGENAKALPLWTDWACRPSPAVLLSDSLTRDQHAGHASTVSHPQHVLKGAELQAMHMARESVGEIGLFQGGGAGLARPCPYVDHITHACN